MKKINSILNGESSSYGEIINNLSKVLEPFAASVVGETPVYMGFPVKELEAGVDKNTGAHVFIINETVLAVVNLDTMEASVCGSNYVKLQPEDAQTVARLIKEVQSHNSCESCEEPCILRILKLFQN